MSTARLRSVNEAPRPLRHRHTPRYCDAVTETSRRVDRPAAPFGGRSWVHFVWWLGAWNAAVPIRLIGILPDAMRRPGAVGPVVQNLFIEQTSWALATYVMFHI